MKIFFILPILLFVGCANVASTKFSYSDPNGSTVRIEMPKEVDAKELRVEIDAKSGTATITAKEWSSRNVETIASQGERESKSVEKAAKGIAEGVVDGVKGSIP